MTIRTLPEVVLEGLDNAFDPLVGPTWGPYAESTKLDLAIHAQREVIHHTAEIFLLRDLYAHQP